MPSPSEAFARYARQMSLPGMGLEGQKRLQAARVLVIGLGGLGSPAAMYLAAAGVGTLGLADFDTVAASNLHRQLLHDHDQLGATKLASASHRLLAINPDILLEAHPMGLQPDNALALFAQYDCIVDGSDNFGTRYLANDAAHLAQKPLVYGALFQFEGQVSVFDRRPDANGPCYRCLFPEMPAPGEVPNCAEAGVLGALCGIVGSFQAMETLKLLTGLGEPLTGRLLRIDALSLRVTTIQLKADPHCALCGHAPTITSIEPDRYAHTCDLNHEPIPDMKTTTVQAAAKMPEETCFIDVREPFEWEICHLPNARLIPLADLPEKLACLPKTTPFVVYCHHGMRSLNAVNYLHDKGLTNALSMDGGIDAWSLEIDDTLPRY